jgi:hypothetical protein
VLDDGICEFTGNNIIAVGMFPDNNGFQVFARGIDNRIYDVWHDRWNWRSMDWTYLGGPSDRKFIGDPAVAIFLMAAFRYSLELRTTDYTEYLTGGIGYLRIGKLYTKI